jgi:hypothetical protein
MGDRDLTVWAGLAGRPLAEVLPAIAEEMWRRTKAPLFAAERARAELAVWHAPTPEARRQALAHLTGLHQEELAESRRQAALVGYALLETAAEGYEAWCQAALARLHLPPIGEAEAAGCWEQARRAAAELHGASEAGPGQAA